MNEGERQRRGNARGAIVLLLLTALAGVLAWRNRTDPTTAEREAAAPALQDDAIEDELRAARFDGTSIRVTVHGLDAGLR